MMKIECNVYFNHPVYEVVLLDLQIESQQIVWGVEIDN
jgi:hypothetical protein